MQPQARFAERYLFQARFAKQIQSPCGVAVLRRFAWGMGGKAPQPPPHGQSPCIALRCNKRRDARVAVGDSPSNPTQGKRRNTATQPKEGDTTPSGTE